MIAVIIHCLWCDLDNDEWYNNSCDEYDYIFNSGRDDYYKDS